MKREELLPLARKHMWAAWALSSEELASQAADTLIGLGMLVPEGGAAELERLRARVAELEAERHTTNEVLSDAAVALREAQSERLSFAERAARESRPAWRAGWLMLAQAEESKRVADVLLASEAGGPADRLTRLIAPTQALREDEPAEVKDGCPRNVIDGDVGGHFFKHGAIVDGPMRCVYCGVAKPEAGA